MFYAVIISPEKNILQREITERALRYIHLRTLDLGFTVRVGAKLRC